MLRLIWPMKSSNDESFRLSNKQKTIYDDVLADMPEYSYDMEMVKYNELRWKKGFVHNVVPSICYGSIAGFCWGLNESRRGLVRHVSRWQIITGNVLTGAGLALCTSGVHQGLLMAADYKAAVWQPIVAGCGGGAIFSALAEGTTIGKGAGAGFAVGVAYTIACIGAEKYQERSLTNFFVTQQQRETPITKITPEVQRLYRAWLYDHRPIEDYDKVRREALVLDREAGDTRLDAQTFIKAMTLEQLDFIEFPEWWPLKLKPKTDKAAVVEKRMRDDAYERRKMALLENQIMFSHPMRTESGKALSDGRLDMPSERS